MYGYNGRNSSALYQSVRASGKAPGDAMAQQPTVSHPAIAATSGAALRQSLYGARLGSGQLQPATAIFKALDGPVAEKSMLAAAVEDAIMSPAPEAMCVDPAGGMAAEMLQDFAAGSGPRLRMGAVSIAAMAAAGQSGAPATALYGNYQQQQGQPSRHKSALYSSQRPSHLAQAAAAAIQARQAQAAQAAAAAAAAASAAAAAASVAPSGSRVTMDLGDVLKRASGAGPGGSVLYGAKRPTTTATAVAPMAATARSSSVLYGDYLKRQRGAEPMQTTPDAEMLRQESGEETFLDCQEELAAGQQAAEAEHTKKAHGGPPPTCDSASSMYGCYWPTMYSDTTSPEALRRANDVMSRMYIPGGTRFMCVPEDSQVYQMGVAWGFSAFAISLGSSYFQRLVVAIPQLGAAVRSSAKYAPYCMYMAGGAPGPPKAVHHVDAAQESTLQSIQFTCTYLATKVVDRVPHLEMLRYMLTQLYGALVSRAQAYEVEAKCLEGLKYRLGPYFREDSLEGPPHC